MFNFGYKRKYENAVTLCEHQCQEIDRLKKENRLLASECNDLKAELKDMTLHLASLGLINGCLMDVVTEDQKKVVRKKIKIKEGKKHGKTKKAK